MFDFKLNIPKTIIALLATIYFIWCGVSPYENGRFLHSVNFPIHEAGHVVFSGFNEFMAIAGGSLFQILVPIGFCIYFATREEFFSSAIVLFWVGNNFLDVAIYAKDAVFMELPLWSMSGNEETTIHDWNYLLTHTQMLHHTDLIAGIIRGMGIVITVVAIVTSLYYANKQSDFEPDSEE